MEAVIYHNPACGTSRKVLAYLKEKGVKVKIVEYLKTPPSRAELENILQLMDAPLRAILRKRGTPYDELSLGDPSVTDEAIFAAIAKHPALIERPIVVFKGKAQLCRPAETIERLAP
jgi:arsenate reductase (glutaredoxin)